VKQIEKLYLQYKQGIYAYLISITHNPTLSEDLLQETFLKAIYSISNFEGSSSVKTWLFSISRHLWLQSLRKQKATIEYSDLLEIYVADSIENSFITKQAVDRIHELLQAKDDCTQKVIHMRVGGFSFSEISEKLGISESSARVINFRVKKWLRLSDEYSALA